jgi:hypothetical protein
MKKELMIVEEERRPGRTCANEGCERPAEARLCGPCALEWSLFHREERTAPQPSADRRARSI